MILGKKINRLSAKFLKCEKTFCDKIKLYSIKEVNESEDLTNKWKHIQDHWTREYYNSRKISQEDYQHKLTGLQRQRVDILVAEISGMNKTEQRYLAELMEDSVNMNSQMDLQTIYQSDSPKLLAEFKGTWPPENPNWIRNFGAFSSGGSAGPSGQSAKIESQEEVVSEQKEEVVEKTSFNLVLNAFDSSSKIKIIKEVKNLFGLGLKESKDLVEKLPAVLKENINKQDGEVMLEKFVALGCKIELQ